MFNFCGEYLMLGVLRLQRALASAMRGRTVFIIAHRMSTIQAADKIIVLRDGAVVESGSHSELVHKKGLYAELVWRQQMPGGSVAVVDDVFNSITTEISADRKP